ncbi:ribosomal protein S18 acetylase RimI-like enzyme [Serratia fonticola]|uniref:Ribosomal protein S18 acetylase RimI-like enzyme n=1 Tax=Serratia fonticola TaxID=47917 RepID=A0A542D5M4_SERFO|nr:GNAT family N-acetyltransferase [Serratia fonticola]TQI79639.1 ribosomal protein S18 acetylase RimI-like enzyme [Serratia fonticola]TQI98335.1 ribosomal protein S18 acetylase RimI-like enzyme [Serratia fonticola]TVZ67863.1 ribosomal protein S18 acetylase RimI-like enzyme [Serratia fonticola]
MFTIRQALPADLTVVREVGIRSYQAHFGALWYNPDEMETFLAKDFAVAALETSLQDPLTCWLLAYEDSTPIGVVRLNFDRLLAVTSTCGAELQKIYFLPGLTGRGFGERLYRDVQQRAIDKRQKLLWLEVLKSNVSAQRFYQRQGLQIVGENRFSSASQSVDLWYMAKNL